MSQKTLNGEVEKRMSEKKKLKNPEKIQKKKKLKARNIEEQEVQNHSGPFSDI